jgi:signal transduction histidine kinase
MGVEATSALRSLAAMRWRLGLGGGGVLLILAALAWIVTSRATGELLRLATEIEALQAGSLDRRLAHRATLEVDQLVVVLNRLLARLETAVGHLRRFTADAAHELRTPVAALRATLEVALSRDTPERWREGLLDGLEQSERVGRLAESLLALSAVEAGAKDAQRVPVRLDRLAAEVADELEPIAVEQRRPMRCEPGDEVWVVGVPDLLQRVVANLIDNAFCHTPPTSAVTVRVRADGEWARVTVTDEGPGIAADDRPRVFERFGRGRGASAKGAGLGLALSREVAERHGGTLEIESDVQRGTQATLSLPLVATPAARATA